MSPKKSRLILRTTLSVLEDLGINLYTNAAAVLSEIVANAWDADAGTVTITTSGTGKKKTLVIEDDGIGMSVSDVNARYLTVGYKRREATGGKSAGGRPVMGRKGIGKLSIFAISDKVEIHTVKGKSRCAFLMSLSEIRKKAKAEQPYAPPEIVCAADLEQGTRIILRDLKSSIQTADRYLRRRLSRRFTVIDGASGFEVKINGHSLTLEDRDYYGKLQYVWHYDAPEIVALSKNAQQEEARPSTVLVGSKGKPTRVKISGWIASVKQRSQLYSEDDENLNRIALVVRGKLAHENILEEFSEAGVYATYLIGEIHADFLDVDGQPDIATSSRQRIMETDPRYVALKAFLRAELKHIESSWTAMRNRDGLKSALEIPAIQGWYNSLSEREQKAATALLGKVNTLPIEMGERHTFFKQAVLAFEMYRVKNNLEALEAVTPDQILIFGDVFKSIDDIEATLYFEIVKQRLGVISKLEQHVDDDVKEKILQAHVYDHLWLLDPSWERATEHAVMEKSVQKMIENMKADLPAAIRKSRVDIKYREVSGRHVIIELKRASVLTNTDDVLKQVNKYARGMRELLRKSGAESAPFEIIVLLGREPADWKDDPGARQRAAETIKTSANARVMLYDEVILNAKARYREYLAKEEFANKLSALLASIEEADLPSAGIFVPGAKRKKLPQASTMKPVRRAKAK